MIELNFYSKIAGGQSVQIRNYQPTDAGQMARLIYNTVHTINQRDYSPAQLKAWMPEAPSQQAWAARYPARISFVADDNGMIAGFAELEPNGHVDCFYCHHSYQRQGIGQQLYQRLEQEAKLLNLERLFVEASITARSFFERMGFQTLHENHVLRNDVMLTNFAMEKYLS
jgi:putative acetyltransferase